MDKMGKRGLCVREKKETSVEGIRAAGTGEIAGEDTSLKRALFKIENMAIFRRFEIGCN